MDTFGSCGINYEISNKNVQNFELWTKLQNIESYRDDRGLQTTVTIVDYLPKFDSSHPMNKGLLCFKLRPGQNFEFFLQISYCGCFDLFERTTFKAVSALYNDIF